ncbi:MAG: TIGR02147 family protein [Bdellovibrionales bacterium]|nr:TIGR02147 family protein [Bdellovibrionales bacterium]
MDRISPYEFNNVREYLREVFELRRKRNPRYSLRAWARQIGLPHPSMLSMVLNGRRKLYPTLAGQIRNTLELEANEAHYFDILTLFTLAERDDEKLCYSKILVSLKPNRATLGLEFDALRFLSNWYFVAIAELPYLKAFRSDPAWIARRLKLGVSQVEECIEALLRLGIFERNEAGELRRTQTTVTTPIDNPNEAVKRLHEQMLAKAAQALRSQGLDERDFSSRTFAFEESKLNAVKQRIRDFRAELDREFSSEAADSLYSLNIQFFDLTGKENAHETN